MSKFDLAVIVTAIVGGALWIEHRHRIVIDAPAATDIASPACPDNDNVPYSASCIRFLGGSHVFGVNWQANAAESEAAAAARAPR